MVTAGSDPMETLHWVIKSLGLLVSGDGRCQQLRWVEKVIEQNHGRKVIYEGLANAKYFPYFRKSLCQGVY